MTNVKNIVSYTAIRLAGFAVAFFGIILLVLKNSSINIVLQLVGILLLLIGVLYVSTSIKKLIRKNLAKNKKDATLYLLLGLLIIAVGVLLLVFKSQLGKWINLIIGIIIAIYGLSLFIYFLVKKGKRAWFIISIIAASLFLVSGVMQALIYFFTSSTYVLITGIILTTTGAYALILY